MKATLTGISGGEVRGEAKVGLLFGAAQKRAAGISPMQLLLAGAQRRSQFALQGLEVAELSPDLKELFLQAKTHRGAGL